MAKYIDPCQNIARHGSILKSNHIDYSETPTRAPPPPHHHHHHRPTHLIFGVFQSKNALLFNHTAVYQLSRQTIRPPNSPSNKIGRFSTKVQAGGPDPYSIQFNSIHS